MDFDFEVKSYRCFSRANPLRFRLTDGFTAFLGPNNAGKSSALRMFFELGNVWNVCRSLDEQIVRTGHGIHSKATGEDSELFHHGDQVPIEIKISPATHVPGNIRSCTVRVNPNMHVEIVFDGFETAREELKVHDSILFSGSNPQGSVDWAKQLFNDLRGCMYIPGNRAILGNADNNYYDVSVGSLFVQKWDEWQNGGQAQSKAIGKVVRDLKRIFELDHLEIRKAHSQADALHVSINNIEQKLRELGSGLSEFIFVLGNLAVKKPTYVLIDEPESHLHPKLQLDFLTTVALYCTKGVVFSTHSLGLARSVAEYIYVLQDNGSDKTCKALGDPKVPLATLAGELSFSSFKELGFNKIVLVEGPTDVGTYQQWIRKYGKDHEVVLIPLGGDGMINASRENELVELTRIGAKVVAIIDSEKESQNAPLSPKRQGFVQACRDAEVDCFVLERRATENYFTESAISKAQVFGSGELGHYERRGWDKKMNWRIAHYMTRDELDATDLGPILATI
jgi:ABC-type cobalamin/Fe3+-siderophores transport system ATPase subunit